MKQLIIAFLLFVPLIGHCQTEQEKYYIYNIVSFEGDFTKENIKVYYDDGKKVKRLKTNSDNEVRFTTPAGALMYFISQGWEMYLNGATSSGTSFNGTGGSYTKSYWILRKLCTKDEFEKAVEEAVKK